MKKIIIISCLICFSTGIGFSQIKFGIRGGVNWNYVKADDLLVKNNTQRLTIPSKANLGYHVGVISQIRLSNLFVQPELLFTANKNDVILKDEQTSQNIGLAEQRIYRLDIPVLVGVRISSVKFEAGPIGTIILGSKSELIDIRDYEQKFKTLTYGFQVGVGLDFSKISLDLKYEGKLSKFGDELTIGNESFKFDQHANQLVFSIGLFL